MRIYPLVGLFIVAMAGLSACSKESGTTADRFEIPELDSALVVLARTDSVARASIPVAYIDGEPILAGVLETQLKLLMSEDTRKDFRRNPDVLQIALSGVMDQMVLAKKAEEMGLELTQEEEDELYLRRVRMISDQYLKTTVKDLATPSDEEARAFYEANEAGYLTPVEIATRHILVDSEAKANALKAAVEHGSDFKKVCRKESLDDLTKDTGGYQGWLIPQRATIGVGKDPGYVDAAMVLEVDELTIYHSKMGWHVIQLVKTRGGDLKPFEEVAEGIRVGMGQRNWGETYNEVCLNLRAEYAATMSPHGIEAYAQVEDTVQRTMALAYSQENATGKIELFRKVVFDYTKSRFAPEAQFMIAYTFLRELHDHWEATRQIDRLTKRFPDTVWAKAGEYLKRYVDPSIPRNYTGHAHDETGGHDIEPMDIEEPHEILKIVESQSVP